MHFQGSHFFAYPALTFLEFLLFCSVNCTYSTVPSSYLYILLLICNCTWVGGNPRPPRASALQAQVSKICYVVRASVMQYESPSCSMRLRHVIRASTLQYTILCYAEKRRLIYCIAQACTTTEAGIAQQIWEADVCMAEAHDSLGFPP